MPVSHITLAPLSMCLYTIDALGTLGTPGIGKSAPPDAALGTLAIAGL